MSDDAKTPDSAADGGEGAKRVGKRQGRSYTKDELLANARSLTGYAAHIVAGALSLDTSKDKWTRKQAEKACEDFLKRPVDAESTEDTEENGE